LKLATATKKREAECGGTYCNPGYLGGKGRRIEEARKRKSTRSYLEKKQK
jgi:hypothetical protein